MLRALYKKKSVGIKNKKAVFLEFNIMIFMYLTGRVSFGVWGLTHHDVILWNIIGSYSMVLHTATPSCPNKPTHISHPRTQGPPRSALGRGDLQSHIILAVYTL